MGYMLAKAANDHGQQVSVACGMSNHHHAQILDLTGNRGAFMQQFHSNLARKRNLQLDTREQMWGVSRPGDMLILDMDSIVESLLYISLQPVAAGCVERCSDWTGLIILPRHWGSELTFQRPAECGPEMPETVSITPLPPPGLDHLPLDQAIGFAESLIERQEDRLASKRKIPVLGIEYCEAINPMHTPKTKAPIGKLNPKFRCKDLKKLFRALARERSLRREHGVALREFCSGNRDVEFPFGTIQMVRVAGARMKAPDVNDPLTTCTTWTDWLQKLWDDWVN